jgi:hypothetical protein
VVAVVVQPPRVVAAVPRRPVVVVPRRPVVVPRRRPVRRLQWLLLSRSWRLASA